MAFRDRVLVEGATCKAVVLILKGGGQLPQHRSCGGGVEVGNGGFKFLLHPLHHLP